MRLQQMLFVAFASSVLLIGCSKPEQPTSTENQTVIHVPHQIELRSFFDRSVSLSSSSLHSLLNGMIQKYFTYRDQFVYLQNMGLSALTKITPVYIKETKIDQSFPSIDEYKIFTPAHLTKTFFIPFYQKIKVMINGEITILNC